MWNSKEAKSTFYEENLFQSLLDKDSIIMFSKLNAFRDIIRYLPNQKFFGVDDIFNFFIKKIKSLHQPLYEIIKGKIVEGDKQLSDSTKCLHTKSLKLFYLLG
ncbi:hypothetical protein NUSPORA_00451 [Nucleospora cyclopteri]